MGLGSLFHCPSNGGWIFAPRDSDHWWFSSHLGMVVGVKSVSLSGIPRLHASSPRPPVLRCRVDDNHVDVAADVHVQLGAPADLHVHVQARALYTADRARASADAGRPPRRRPGVEEPLADGTAGALVVAVHQEAPVGRFVDVGGGGGGGRAQG